MTVSAQTLAFEYTANGVTTTFPYQCRILFVEQLKVYVDGVLQVGGYTVFNVGNQNGGDVVFSAAPANGATVLIRRISDRVRTTDFQQAPYFTQEELLDLDQDYQTMLLQEAAAEGDKSIRIPSEETVNTVLPSAAERAGKQITFGPNGEVQLTNTSAAVASAELVFSPTKSAADSLAASLPDGATVITDEDEDATPAGVQTRRTVVGGALSAIASFLKTSMIAWKHGGTGAVWRTLYSRLMDLKVSVTDFTGFVGDGVNDDTAAVVAAATAALASGRGLHCPPGYSVKLVGDVNLKLIRNIEFLSDIVITGGMVSVGGNVNAGKFNIVFQAVTNGTSTITVAPPATPVFRLTGLSNSEARVGSCNYLQLFAGDDATNERFVAYNQFKLTGSVSLLELTDFGTALSYVNENKIYADRIIRYRIIKNGYPHNHNKLYHPTLEGANAEITMTGALVSANQVYEARFEGVAAAPGITFGAGTYSNTVTSTWSGIGNPRNEFRNFIPISDSGQGNMVTTEAAYMFNKTEIFNVGANSQILSTATATVAPDPRIAPDNAGVNNLTARAILAPSLAGFGVPNTFRWIALSEPIAVRLGDVIGFDADFDGALLRSYIFVLDENMEPLLDNTGGDFVVQTGTTFSATYGSYSQGANQTAATMRSNTAAVVRNEVKFIRVGAVIGTAGFIRSISAHIYTQAIGRDKTEAAARFNSPRSLDGIPTRGYAPLNTLIYDHTATVMRRCSYQYETRLNGALATGATSVTVVAPASIANGDVVGILLDNNETHWSAVSGLSGSTFTIAAIPAGRSAPAGGRIVFNRWV